MDDNNKAVAAGAVEAENAAEPKYMKEALLLANSYTDMLKERDSLQRLLDGNWVYTKEMAISDLDSISVSYDGDHVQSSNISNPTERIAMKLTDEYMARKQREMDAEKEACARELEYVNWKIEVVETVWKERAKERERLVFQLLFYQHKTFKEAENLLLRKKKQRIPDCSIMAAKEKLWVLFLKEIEFRSQDVTEQDFVKMLMAEVEKADREDAYGRQN